VGQLIPAQEDHVRKVVLCLCAERLFLFRIYCTDGYYPIAPRQIGAHSCKGCICSFKCHQMPGKTGVLARGFNSSLLWFGFHPTFSSKHGQSPQGLTARSETSRQRGRVEAHNLFLTQAHKRSKSSTVEYPFGLNSSSAAAYKARNELSVCR